MTTVVFGFSGGLYHATPWGHHVNEGMVEWPPSPWRLLRAFVAVGYSALGWDEGVPEVAHRLMETLADLAPSYTLPPATTAHSRHYMPLEGFKNGREDTTLVFDTFARLGDGELAVSWPVSLTNDERVLLAEILRHINYLGRSESWVEARLLGDGDPVPAGRLCIPAAGELPPQGGRYEKFSLMGLLPTSEYAAWRETQPSPPKGKQSKKNLVPQPPADLWGCLTQATGDLQAAGWSRPPGTQPMLYWRPEGSLAVGVSPRTHRFEQASAECVLLSLSLPSGNLHALPSVVRTLPTADLIHRSAVSLLGGGETADGGFELIGKGPEGELLSGHQHAHILPLDLDRDGHLDHVLVWAPGGLSADAISSLRRLRKTWAKNLASDIRVAVAAIASASELESLSTEPWSAGLTAALGSSRVWRSVTPFFPPRYLKPKGKNSLEGQVLAELESRGLRAAQVRLMDREAVFDKRFRHYVKERRTGPQAKSSQGFGLELVFDAPVQGPICLGYGSHFGLGRFETVTPQ